ncbi:MAG: hypothetical protein U1E65_25275 [Myxococcota bacterium]
MERLAPPRPRAPFSGLLALAFVARFVAACQGGAAEPDDGGLLNPVAKDGGFPSGADAGTTEDGAAIADSGPIDTGVPPTPDRDQDGLPDAVDPSPDVPNRQLYADDFHEVGADWLFTSTVMRIESGVLRADPPDGLVREGWIGPRNQWTDTIVHARLRVLGVGPGHAPGSGRGGIMGRAQTVVPDRYFVCGVDQKTHQAFLALHNGGLAEGLTLAQSAINLPLDTWVDVTLSMNGPAVRCRIGEVSLSASDGTYSDGSIGVRVFDAGLEVDDVSVYAF